MKMKLFLRRYLTPFVLLTLIYSFLYFVFKTSTTTYFNVTLIPSLISIYLLRVLDDYDDYDTDLKNDKVLFDKKTGLIILAVLTILFVFCSMIIARYLFVLILVILALGIIKKYGIIFKMMFVPTLMALIIYYEMEFSYWFIVVVLISVLINVLKIKR